MSTNVPIRHATPAPPGRSRTRSAIAAYWRIHLASLHLGRTLLAAAGITLGTAAILGMLILLGAVRAPYSQFAATVRPESGAQVVTSLAGAWMPASVYTAIPAAADPAPLAVGFGMLRTADRAEGVLAIGSDCRLVPYVTAPADRDRAAADCRRRVDELTAVGADPATPRDAVVVHVSERVAAALGVSRGDIVTGPGGRRVVIAGIAPAPPGVNAGAVIVGEGEQIARLLGHPGALTAILVDRPLRLDPALGAELTDALDLRRPPVFANIESLLLLAGVIVGITGAFLASSTFVVGSEDRKRTLAIAAAVGRSRRSLVIGYLGEGGLVGIVGGIAAIPFGMLLGAALVSGFGADLLSGTGVHLSAAPSLGLLALTPFVGAVLGVIAAGLTATAVFRGSDTDVLSSLLIHPAAAPLPWWPLAGAAAAIGAAIWVGSYAGDGSLPVLAAYAATGLLSFGLVTAALVLGPRVAALTPSVRWGRLESALLLMRGDLDRSPVRSGATVAILALGVMLLVGIPGVQQANTLAFVHRNPPLVQSNQTVVVGKRLGQQAEAPIPDEVVSRLRTDPRIAAVSVRAQLPVQSRFTVVGLEPDGLFLRQSVPTIPPEQRRQILADGGVILSSQAANRFGVAPGGAVTLPTTEGPRQFRVGATFETDGDDVGLDALVLVDLATARRLWGNATTGLLVQPAAGYGPADVAAAVGTTGGLRVYDKASFETAAGAAFTTFLRPFTVVGWAVLIVAAFGVVNMLLLAMLQRRHERACLRAIGLPAGLEAAVVLGDAVALGVVAAVLGVLGGIAFVAVMVAVGPAFFALRPEFCVPVDDCLLAAGLVVGISVVGSLPALAQCFRLDVTDALHVE